MSPPNSVRHLVVPLIPCKSTHPQGFLTCPVLGPAAQAHPSRTRDSLVLGATSASASWIPVPAPALECSPWRLSQGSNCSGTGTSDTSGYLDKHPHCPWVAPAKQLGLEQDLATFCLELQGKCIIPNPHQAPSLALAWDHYYKK